MQLGLGGLSIFAFRLAGASGSLSRQRCAQGVSRARWEMGYGVRIQLGVQPGQGLQG